MGLNANPHLRKTNVSTSFYEKVYFSINVNLYRIFLFKVANGNALFGFYLECYVWHQLVILSVIIGLKIGANGRVLPKVGHYTTNV